MKNNMRETVEGFNAVMIGDYKVYAVSKHSDQFHIKQPYADIMTYVQMKLQMEIDKYRFKACTNDLENYELDTIITIPYDPESYVKYSPYDLLDIKIRLDDTKTGIQSCIQVIHSIELIPSTESSPNIKIYINPSIFSLCIKHCEDNMAIYKVMSALMLTSSEKTLFKYAEDNAHKILDLETIASGLGILNSYRANPRVATRTILNTVDRINSKIHCNLCCLKQYDGRKVIGLDLYFARR